MFSELKEGESFILDNRMYDTSYYYDLFKSKGWQDIKILFFGGDINVFAERKADRGFCARECKGINLQQTKCKEKKCTGNEIVRPEDEPTAILKVLKEQQEQLEPVKEFWSKQNEFNFNYIDATKAINEIHQEIVHLIESDIKTEL